MPFLAVCLASKVPLGKGLPACAPLADKKAVRCCGDELVASSNSCPKSVLTCGELAWPVVAAAGGGDAFCPAGSATTYPCAGNRNHCFEKLARPCTMAEVDASRVAVPGFPAAGVTVHQLGESSGAPDDGADRCMCCADAQMMPAPCTRPYKLSASDDAKEYSFEISTDEARLCTWVFDGCDGAGVLLRFVDLAANGANIHGDGLGVFGAESPVDLEAVEQMQFSRRSILAEIREHSGRTFRRDSSGTIIVPHGQAFASRDAGADFLVTSPTSAAIVELKSMAKGAALAGTPVRFSLEYSCTPAVGGCMDSAADNYDSAATFDDASCAYSPAVGGGCSESSPDGGCEPGHTCTSNPRRSSDECACVV
eukprot:SAG22_NODE_4044_length_1409_cov_1.211450_1_plen_366_part_10